jgi:hypothetical protein
MNGSKQTNFYKYYKTPYIQFTASNNNPLTEIEVAYDIKQIISPSNIKFLGIYIDDKMSWKHHIEQISPKLNTVCYIITIKPYISINTLKMAYYSYFNSFINYGLPFWGNSPKCINIFRIQKKIISIMLAHVEICSENKKSCLWHLSTYFLLCSL